MGVVIIRPALICIQVVKHPCHACKFRIKTSLLRYKLR